MGFADPNLASFNEKLLLGNGLCVSPLNGQQNNQGPRSLRDVTYHIDNTRDLENFVSSFASKAGVKNPDIRYERHPVNKTKPRFHRSHIANSIAGSR